MERNEKNNASIIKKINYLRRKRNAIIVAHVYQRAEVQDIADYVADSLELARKTVASRAKVIVFCGVQFMAEIAKILNPDKVILLPEKAACPLADSINLQDIKKVKKELKDYVVVSYVNSPAAVKAESEICCTSANAVDVVNSLENHEKILFVPDKNLGRYVMQRTGRTRKNMKLWHGFCYVHENINANVVRHMKEKYKAEVIAHPECKPDVLKVANYIGGTFGMRQYVKKSKAKRFVVCTEDGLLHTLKKENPDKKFYGIGVICNDMKLTTLRSIAESLEKMQYKIKVPKAIAFKAKKAIDRMLDIK